MSVATDWKPVTGQMLAIAAVLTAGWFFGTRPIKARQVAAAESLAKVERETGQLRRLSETWGGDGGALLAEVSQLASKLDRASGSDTMSGWDRVRASAAQVGVTVAGVDTVKSGRRGLRGQGGVAIETESVEIECVGSFESIAAFCDLLEGLDASRLGAVSRVEELKLAPDLEGQILASIRVTGLWFEDSVTVKEESGS